MLVMLAVLGAPSAFAADVCEMAASPSDKLPVENCDGCDETGVASGPDATFRFLSRMTDEGTIPLKNRKLAALASDAVADALRKGLDLKKTFALGEYGSAGVSTRIAAMLGNDLTAAQREAATRDGAVWLKHEIAAQAAASLGTTVPVGPNGFYVRTGIGAGGAFSVRTEKRYSPQLADAAKNAVMNQLTIPYAAIDAEGMRAGERVVLAGNGNIAVSGGAGYGVDAGAIVPGVSAGATVSAGSARVVSGAFETEITREAGSIVRVKLRSGTSDDASSDFRAFAGVKIDPDGLEIPVMSGISVIDGLVRRGARAAERALSAEFTTRHGDLDAKGDIQEYTFDLGRRASRRAYEDALRGDFRAAAALAACGTAGVGFVQDVNEKISREYDSTKLSVSLLRYSVEKSSTDTVRNIRDAAGARSFEIHEFAYDRRGFFGSGARVSVGAVHSMRGALGDDGKSVHLTYRGDLENAHWTSRGEMKDIIAIGRAVSGPDITAHGELRKVLDSGRSGAHLPNWLNYYGKTQMALDLTVSEQGIERIAGATEEQLWAAFVDARHETPRWASEAGRDRLEREHRARNAGGPRSNNPGEPTDWHSYARTKKAIAALRQIGETTDEGQRAKLLRNASEAMGDDFTAGAAISTLAGADGRSVKFGVKNDNVDYTYTHIGTRSAVVPVN